MIDNLQWIYVNAIGEKYQTHNEDSALIQMVERLQYTNALEIYDSMYEFYTNMVHLQIS